METATSNYQTFKLWLAGYVPIDRDWLHVLIGLTLVIAAIAISRKSLRATPFFLAFIVALGLGIAMELLDRLDDIRTFGAWQLRASLADVARTALAPVVAFWIVLALQRRGK